MGKCLLAREQVEKAIEEFNIAIRVKPNYQEAKRELAQIFEEQAKQLQEQKEAQEKRKQQSVSSRGKTGSWINGKFIEVKPTRKDD